LLGNLWPRIRPCGDAGNRGQECSGIAALGRDAAEFEQRRQIVRMLRENLLDDLLEIRFAVSASLAFNFESKLVVGAKIRGIQFDGLTKVSDGCGGIAAIVLKNPQREINSIVGRSKISCAIESLCRGIEVALPQRENASVGPCGGLCWNQFSGIAEARVRANVVTDLQCGKTNVEG
jgi:hypothetical protein